MAITREEVLHVARLARLELSDDEVTRFQEQLSAILEAYRAAARRCREGELDGVEVTMAHGMLLASFLSPLMNHREDRYGGDREGRRTICPARS